MNLPEGWALSEIGELGEIITGKTPSTKVPENFGGSIPFIKPGDLDHGGYIHFTADTLTELGLKSVPKLPPNSITVTCIGNLGKIGITTTESATNQQINSVVPSRHLNYKFLYHYLATLKPWLEQEASATTVAIINKGKFSKAPIKVAPLAEQHQIATKLDELLAQVDSIKTRLDTIPNILKRFRQSVLAAAVSGKLTEDWRYINQTESWKTVELCELEIDVQIGPFGSLLHKNDYIEGGIPLVNPMHITKGQIIPSDSMSVSREKAEELERYALRRGDIVLGRRGEMGRAAVVKNDRLICGTGSLFLRPDLRIFQPEFICFVLSASETIKFLTESSVGTTMVNLNQGILKKLPFPQVEIEEQTEIVNRVEQLFTYADQVEQRVKDAQSRINHLTQAILAKAFRGELTADWRAQNPDLISGENSAEALLARIQNERNSLATKKPNKKSLA